MFYEAEEYVGCRNAPCNQYALHLILLQVSYTTLVDTQLVTPMRPLDYILSFFKIILFMSSQTIQDLTGYNKITYI